MRPLDVFRYVFCATLFAAWGGCTSALPGKSPIRELEDYAARAQRAEKQARQYSEQARAELERAEMLVAETKAQLDRAEAARQECLAAVRKIPKPLPRKIIVIKEPPEEKKQQAEEQKKQEQQQYSPSDAPITH